MIRGLMTFRRKKANMLPNVIHDLKFEQILWEGVSNGKYWKKRMFISINFDWEYAFRKYQESQEELQLNGTYVLPARDELIYWTKI
jgi:hypothetical protein